MGNYLALGHDVRTSLRSVRTPWPRAKYFPIRPSHLVNKYILLTYFFLYVFLYDTWLLIFLFGFFLLQNALPFLLHNIKRNLMFCCYQFQYFLYFRSYVFLLKCGNGPILLRNTTLEAHALCSEDTLNIIKVLEEYIEENDQFGIEALSE